MNTIKEVEFDYQEYTRKHGPDPSRILPGPKEIKRRRETLKARIINTVNMEIKHAKELKHVFISYCHQNKDIVEQLCQSLRSNGVKVWSNCGNLETGITSKQAIQHAIQHGFYFIVCFSKEYNDQENTYMNEELSIAIDNLQQKPIDKTWFIPVKLNECQIPDIEIGEDKTLSSLQFVNLYENWDTGIKKILNIIPSFEHTDPINIVNKHEISGGNNVLFRAVNGKYYFIPYQEVRWDSKEISLTLTPNLSEQTTFLNSLRKRHNDTLAFAHQEDALWVKPKNITQISTENANVWEVILSEDTTGKAFSHRTEKILLEHLTIDQIANMRAKRLLLNEDLQVASKYLTQSTVYDRMLLEIQIRGELSSEYGNRLQVLNSPIPALYQHLKTAPETFIKFTRLISILHLKLSKAVEEILQLELKLLNPTELQVRFKGRRSQFDINQQSKLLEFEGICPLPK